MRHCTTLNEFSAEELRSIITLGLRIKREPQHFTQQLAGCWLLMLFQKTSTRTRLSFEIGIGKLGGESVVMDWESSNFSISPLAYEAHYVSLHADIIMVRLQQHAQTLEFAQHSRAPLINGCDERFHPCQALADMMTIYERTERWDSCLAFVGVHNNVANSLACGLSRVGMRLILVTPQINPPAEDGELMEQVCASGLVERSLNLRAAAQRAQFVYTDTWVDMEHYDDPAYQPEKERRLRELLPYQLNEETLAGSEAWIMHDMPVHPGFEIDEKLIYHPRSLIFQQAENRMYVQQALMLFLLGRV